MRAAAARPLLLAALCAVGWARRLDTARLDAASQEAFPPRRVVPWAVSAAATGRAFAFAPPSPEYGRRAKRPPSEVGPLRYHSNAPGTTDLAAELPGLTQIEANDILRGKWGSHTVLLPTVWVRGLISLSVMVNEQADLPSNIIFAGRARFARGDAPVAIAAVRSDDPESVRQLRISELLSGTGVAPAVFDTKVYGDTTYVLTESQGMRDLEMLILEHVITRKAGASSPAVPVETLLPIMVDLLRSLVTLERFSVILGDLTENNIFLLDQDQRALITDFHSASLEPGFDPELGPEALRWEPGSAFHHAPEMEDGIPYRVESNVWQMGLVFSRMILGGDVPTMLFAGGLDDTTGAGRQRIRDTIRQRFSIEEVLSLQAMSPEYAGLADILVGMLRPDPNRRWSAGQALQAAELLAKTLQVELPAPRPPQALPEGWPRGA